MSPNADQTVSDAIAAIRSGDKERGRILLTQGLRLNPQHEQAWLWMSAVAETPEQQCECLERVLAINPQNSAARQGLKMFERTQAPSSLVSHLRQTSAAPMRDHIRLTDGMAEPMDASASRATSHRISTSVSRETPRTSAPERNPTARRCPQCGAALSYDDDSCAFCGSRVAHTQENDSSLSYTPVSSYPKRRALTRKDQRRLIGQTWKRTPVDHLLNWATISGSIILVFCIGMAIAPLFSATNESESGTIRQRILALYPLWLILPSVWGISAVNTIIEGVQSYRFSQALRAASAVAEAPILDVWHERGFEREPYIVAWELTASDGKGRPVQRRGAQQISKKLFHHLQQCDTVRVRFVPHQPDISALDPQWVAAIEQHIA
jgi:hypothetical protein